MLKSLRYGKEFEELYTGNYSRLYYYAYQFLNDAEVSRDVVNDAFEYVWKNYENFRKMNVVAILFQSVRNKSIDTFRHNKVEENYVALYSRMLSEEDAGLDEENEKMRELGYYAPEENEKIERIYKVLDNLTPQTRHIMEECYFNRKKYAEVAEMLNISPSAVKKHVMKALRLLREEFHINNGSEGVPENEV